MGEKEREGDLCSRIGNWVQESVMMEDTDAGEHRPTSSSGAMLNGETYLVSGRRKGARTAGSKSRARTGTGRSGADVWAGDEKERVSRSRTRTSGIASRSRYTAPKLVRHLYMSFTGRPRLFRPQHCPSSSLFKR